MVFVKVRETYDLHTIKNKMTVIGIHTPKPDIIKANFPGLLLQCKSYRPVSADVRVACASTQPLDPLGVGLAEGDVAPEDLFNPILYKACSNFGMSQIESRINLASHANEIVDVAGQSADVNVDSASTITDEFPLYYGFLSNAHEWRHVNPQQGLEMSGLRPLVYEVLYNIADQGLTADDSTSIKEYLPAGMNTNGTRSFIPVSSIRGNGKPIPFINCTSYSAADGGAGTIDTGFQVSISGANARIQNAEVDVPWINCIVGAIIIPPSRLHELFYRMVIEWTIEFSSIRPLSEVVSWTGLSQFGNLTHYQNYDYSSIKKALGVEGEAMDHDQTMVSANVEINKVM